MVSCKLSRQVDIFNKSTIIFYLIVKKSMALSVYFMQLCSIEKPSKSVNQVNFFCLRKESKHLEDKSILNLFLKNVISYWKENRNILSYFLVSDVCFPTNCFRLCLNEEKLITRFSDTNILSFITMTWEQVTLIIILLLVII